jgi:hypothetical protein
VRREQGAAGNLALQRLYRSGIVRAKLAIGAPGDPVEHEADRMADRILRGESLGHARDTAYFGGPNVVRRASDSARAPSGGGTVAPSLGGGQALSPHVQSRFAPDLRREFADVRLHTGNDAAHSARALGARAFTLGRDVVFGAGEYRPESPAGQQLVAHELAHVWQQRSDGSTVIRRDELDDEIAREREEERDADMGPIQFVSDWAQSLGAAVQGPLAAGEVVEDHGLVVTQNDELSTTIELGDRRIELRAPDRTERYAFWVEPLALPPAPMNAEETFGGLVLQLPGPPQRIQRVVRVAATSGVRIDAPSYYYEEPTIEGELPRPELVAQVRLSSRESLDSMSEMLVSPWVREVPLSGNAVQLELDDTRIRISPPGSERGFQGGDFPTPRFAYSFDPLWTGPERNEKQVYIVASPGVRVETGEPVYGLAIRHYDRKLVPVVIRVPHPSLVPEQGTDINPDEFIGARPLEEPGPLPLFAGAEREAPRVQAVAGLSGGVTIAHASGAMISIRPVHPERGASFAYEVIPEGEYGVTEVRLLVGPDVHVEVLEPVTAEGMPESFQRKGAGFSRAGIDIRIVEVFEAERVPPQGTPLNLNYYLTLGNERQPNAHRWMETSTLGYDLSTSVVEGAVGFIPIVGDIADFLHFGYAIATGRDVWGHELSTADKVVMGIGAVIGLIPIFGDIIKSGLRAGVKGANVALDLASASARLGTSPEILEVLAHRVSRAAPAGDAQAVQRVNTAFRTGGDINVDDVDRVAGVLRRLGAGENLLGTSRFGQRAGLIALDQTDEAARLGRRSPDVDMWYGGLNRETRELFQGTPGLAKTYEGMDPGVRRLFTHCGSACVLNPAPTRAQQARVKAISGRLGVQAGSFAERRIKTFLHLRRADLDVAINELDGITQRGLGRFLGNRVPNADVVLMSWPGLRARPATRTAVDDAIAAGIDVEQLANIMDSAKAAGLAGGRMLGYVTELGRLRRAGIGGVDEVLDSLSKGGNWARGSEWVLRYCDSIGWRGITAFEFKQTVSWGNDRITDVMFGSLRVQFKSWSQFNGSTFVRQIEKDFDLVQGNLNDLRWFFDPRKPLRNVDDIRAAAEQALRNPNRTTPSRLTPQQIDDIIDALPTIIQVP